MIRKIVIIVMAYLCLDVLALQAIPRVAPDVAAMIGIRTLAGQAATAPPAIHDLPGFYSLRPGFAGSVGWGPYEGQPYFTNSLGFKDGAPRQVPPQPTGNRVLVLGDSFTEGVGMPQSKTFVGLLDARFAKTEFLNAALQGYSPRNYLAKTRYLWNQVGLRFDRAIVFVDVSDVPNESSAAGCGDQRGSEHHRPRPPVAEPAAAPLPSSASGAPAAKPTQAADHSAPTAIPTSAPAPGFSARRLIAEAKTALKQYTLLGRLLDRIKDEIEYRYVRTGLRNVNWSLSLWTLDPEFFAACAAGIGNATQAMSDLATFLRAVGVPLTVVVYPWPDQLFHADRESRHVRIWREWSAGAGVEFIDLFPTFFAQGAPRKAIERLYLRDDVHFSEAGHKLVADTLAALWRERIAAD
jgi:lysophospholipase L1-like esterase